MNRSCIILQLLFVITQTSAQNDITLGAPSNSPSDGFYLERFSYPTFLNGEQHSNFTMGYRLDKKFMTELQGFYDTYILSDVVRFSFRLKYYASDNLYFYTGLGAELEFNKYDGNLSPPRLFILNGAGYDLSKDINLELQHEFQFNKTGLGNYGLPSLLSVHGKYKF